MSAAQDCRRHCSSRHLAAAGTATCAADLLPVGAIAALPGSTDVDVLEQGRDARHREDALHGVASVHE
jgi:hypothetical protein